MTLKKHLILDGYSFCNNPHGVISRLKAKWNKESGARRIEVWNKAGNSLAIFLATVV